MLYKILSVLNKIRLIVLTFLLTIFPSCGILLGPYQSLTYPGQTVITDNVITAINAGDIDALEAMMSENNKKNIEDLPGKIGEFIDAIDGEIIEYSYAGGGYEKDISDYGERYSLRSWDVDVITDTESYRIIITWIAVNSNAPEKVGMSGISILDSEDNFLFSVYAPEE
jgi:hypothetical protein